MLRSLIKNPFSVCFSLDILNMISWLPWVSLCCSSSIHSVRAFSDAYCTDLHTVECTVKVWISLWGHAVLLTRCHGFMPHSVSMLTMMNTYCTVRTLLNHSSLIIRCHRESCFNGIAMIRACASVRFSVYSIVGIANFLSFYFVCCYLLFNADNTWRITFSFPAWILLLIFALLF